MKKIRVTIWNEYVHEQETGLLGDYIRNIYPDGIHRHLAACLATDDLDIRTASLDQPDQGLTDEITNSTDVLIWWGHCAHDRVNDALVEKLQLRVLAGMGLIVLHSGHFSKLFRRLMGTSCRVRWREIGEKERIWVTAPTHPIAVGLPETFTLPHTEMYGERFDLPDDGKIVFMSWYEGGNLLRSGVAFQRDNGRIFYFAPGHETYPIYHDENILKVIGNAIRWATPAVICPPRVTRSPSPSEPVATVNPLRELNSARLHAKV